MNRRAASMQESVSELVNMAKKEGFDKLKKRLDKVVKKDEEKNKNSGGYSFRPTTFLSTNKFDISPTDAKQLLEQMGNYIKRQSEKK